MTKEQFIEEEFPDDPYIEDEYMYKNQSRESPNVEKLDVMPDYETTNGVAPESLKETSPRREQQGALLPHHDTRKSYSGLNIRDFTDTEIAEINKYVVSQIPQSILPQLFLLSEDPDKKIRIFIGIYRIIESARDFVESEDTRTKMTLFLDTGKLAYTELYPKLLKYDTCDMAFRKDALTKDLIRSMLKHNTEINSFTNKFIVFAEKLELISTDTVAGIKLDKQEGIELVKRAQALVDD